MTLPTKSSCQPVPRIRAVPHTIPGTRRCGVGASKHAERVPPCAGPRGRTRASLTGTVLGLSLGIWGNAPLALPDRDGGPLWRTILRVPLDGGFILITRSRDACPLQVYFLGIAVRSAFIERSQVRSSILSGLSGCHEHSSPSSCGERFERPLVTRHETDRKMYDRL